MNVTVVLANWVPGGRERQAAVAFALPEDWDEWPHYESVQQELVDAADQMQETGRSFRDDTMLPVTWLHENRAWAIKLIEGRQWCYHLWVGQADGPPADSGRLRLLTFLEWSQSEPNRLLGYQSASIITPHRIVSRFHDEAITLSSGRVLPRARLSGPSPSLTAR